MNQSIQYEISQVMPVARASTLFVSLCTIQTPPTAQTPSGAPTNNWNAIVGMIAIPCMDEPPSSARVQATEVKDLAEIMAKGLRHILLSGFYPQLVALKFNGQVRALITDAQGNTVTYELLGAESDSQATQTRFECQKVTL